MKIAIAVILVIATFFTTILWSCCCAASRVDREMEDRKDSKR